MDAPIQGGYTAGQGLHVNGACVGVCCKGLGLPVVPRQRHRKRNFEMPDVSWGMDRYSSPNIVP